ncbi:MAG: lamin tail domain-containing protein [Candidatus Magasanikbacteria bacterium]|nr:lamin tail domain-containing protein [Candidatus Magasanikbacteria bacterium]
MTRGRIVFLFASVFLIGGFFIYLAPLWAAETDLQITEIMYDPDGVDTKREWVEIKNTGTAPVDIVGGSSSSSWRFFVDSNHTFTTSTTLAPGGYCAD